MGARDGAGISCPFLHEHVCSIYPVRPSACRGWMSADLEACKTAATVKDGPDITQPVFSIAYRSVVDQALFALLRDRGLSISSTSSAKP